MRRSGWAKAMLVLPFHAKGRDGTQAPLHAAQQMNANKLVLPASACTSEAKGQLSEEDQVAGIRTAMRAGLYLGLN